MTNIAKVKEQIGKESYDQSEKIYADGRMFMIMIIFGALGLGISFGVIISRIISKSINKGEEFAKSVSSGDLTKKLDLNQKDEVGILAQNSK